MVMAGIALSTAILGGALFIGDSMKFSLKQITLSRLGSITNVVMVKDRYFRSYLADQVAGKTGCNVAPVLLVEGSAVSDGGKNRINNVSFIGTDKRFQLISGTDIYNNIPDNEVIISDNLAYHLGVKQGDLLLLRMAKASLIPLNTPFVSDAESMVTFRATVRAIAGRKQMSMFNLNNSQRSPYNIFLSLDKLNSLMNFQGKANRLLINGNVESIQIEKALNESLLPEDAGLILKSFTETHETGINADKIFLDDRQISLFSDVPGMRKILTYFVNSIE
jgi:putative ABC transport system permease protein